jgi:transcription elongation factor Elf1
MDRLALVEARLNPRTVSAVEVSIAEEAVAVAPSMIPEITRYSAFIDMVPRIEEEDEDEEEEEYEMEKMEKMGKMKTGESRSMV